MKVSDEQAENALEYLRSNAGKAARAKAERIYMEEYRKTVKANVMQRHLDKAIGRQESEAYSSQEYKDHLEAMRAAIEADEFNRWGMVAAQATLDAWRTENANKRSEGRMQ
jgi:hypothetical protein